MMAGSAMEREECRKNGGSFLRSTELALRMRRRKEGLEACANILS